VGDKKMTGIEALKALIEGKKIRRENWDKNEAICYSSAWNSFPEIAGPTKAFTMNRWNRINKNEPLDLDSEFTRIYTDFLQDDWEIVE
jgi:hypothetical protein